MSDKTASKAKRAVGLRDIRVGRNYILLIVAIFAAELGYGIVIPAIQLYATNVLGASIGLVGVAIAAFPFTNTFLKIFGGSMADRFGRRLMIIIGLAVSMLSPLLISLITVGALVWVYIPIRALDGAGNSVVWPAANAMVADMMSQGRRDAALGVLNLSFAMGTGIGPAIGLYLLDWFGGVEHGGAQGTFYAAAGLIGLTALFCLLFLQETLRRKRKAKRRAEARAVEHPFRDWLRELGGALKELYTNGKLLALSIQGFINMFIVGLNTSILPLYTTNHIGLSESESAFGFVFISISTILFVYPAGRFGERLGRKYVMTTGMIITGAALFLMPFATHVGTYYVSMIINGVGVALILPTWMSMILDQIPSGNRATILGGVGTITSFGLVVGPIAATALYESVGPGSPFGIAGVLICLNAVFIAFVFRYHFEKHRSRRAEYRSAYYIDQAR